MMMKGELVWYKRGKGSFVNVITGKTRAWWTVGLLPEPGFFPPTRPLFHQLLELREQLRQL
jgi:hypothetical protein